MQNQEAYTGSDFDDFLAEEGLLNEVTAVAAKRILSFQIARAMEEKDSPDQP